MLELTRPDIVDVEEYFNEFVEFYGGEVISKLIDNLIDRPNADYLFRKSKIIAELKCFKKDLFNNPDDIPKLIDFLYDWEKKGLISQGDKIKLIYGQMSLPQECYLDLVRSCRKTVDRAIHKACKQIAETKKTFSMNDAKGIILLANDGNYLIENKGFLAVIGDLMHKKYLNSEVDAFVYFTVNQVSSMPESNLEWTLWAPGYRNPTDKELSDFINDLGHRFGNDFFTLKTGQTPSDRIATSDVEKGYELVRNMEYIPKQNIYKKK